MTTEKIIHVRTGHKTRFLRRLTAKKVGGYLWSIVRFVIVFGLCFEILYPFLVKVLQMFMSQNDLTDPTVQLYPREFGIYFIQRAFDLIDYPVSAWNTLVISLLTSVAQLVICTMAGYGFARFNFKGRGIIFAGVLLILLIPAQVYSTPMYLQFRYFGIQGLFSVNLVDTPLPYFILSLTGLGLKNGLYIYIMRQFFKGMPKELEEAAYIDGQGPYKTFFKIMLPNARNMMIIILVLSFAWQWTDTFYSSLFSLNDKTLPVAILQNIRTVASDGSKLDGMEYSVLRNTACILTIIPLVLIFAVAQKKLVQGIERSGIVG